MGHFIGAILVLLVHSRTDLCLVTINLGGSLLVPYIKLVLLCQTPPPTSFPSSLYLPFIALKVLARFKSCLILRRPMLPTTAAAVLGTLHPCASSLIRASPYSLFPVIKFLQRPFRLCVDDPGSLPLQRPCPPHPRPQRHSWHGPLLRWPCSVPRGHVGVCHRKHLRRNW